MSRKKNESISLFRDYPDVMVVKDIMKALHIGRNTAYRLLDTGQLGSFMLGNSYRITKKHLVEYIEKQGGIR